MFCFEFVSVKFSRIFNKSLLGMPSFKFRSLILKFKHVVLNPIVEKCRLFDNVATIVVHHEEYGLFFMSYLLV